MNALLRCSTGKYSTASEGSLPPPPHQAGGGESPDGGDPLHNRFSEVAGTDSDQRSRGSLRSALGLVCMTVRMVVSMRQLLQERRTDVFLVSAPERRHTALLRSDQEIVHPDGRQCQSWTIGAVGRSRPSASAGCAGSGCLLRVRQPPNGASVSDRGADPSELPVLLPDHDLVPHGVHLCGVEVQRLDQLKSVRPRPPGIATPCSRTR